MKKANLKYLVYLLISSTFSTAQNYEATYVVSYIPNLVTKEKKTELAHLKIGKGNSIYSTTNNTKKDSIFSLASSGQISQFEAIAFLQENRVKTEFNQTILKQYSPKLILVSEDILIDNYQYKQPNELKWTISEDDRIINGFKCFMANTSFYGRDYTAWYTKEVPISDGPYKFWGLPGLIVHIYDSYKEFDFKLVSFNKSENAPGLKLLKQTRTIEVTFEEFKELKSKANSNRAEMMKTMGMDVSQVFINGKRVDQDKELLKKLNRKINDIEKY